MILKYSFTFFLLAKMLNCAISGPNIAYKKPASQSSHFMSYGADRAVDGKPLGNFYDGSCACTSVTDQVRACWWQVDLQSRYRIGEVHIFNRVDCVPERLHDFKIEVAKGQFRRSVKESCNTFPGPASPGWVNVTCTRPVVGRYVRIIKPKDNVEDALTLCEVEIFEASEMEKPRVFGRYITSFANRKLDSDDLKTVKESSLLGCAVICSTTTPCYSFNFRPEDYVCEMITNPKAKLIKTPGYINFVLQ